jgi:hypothetical protein
MESTSRPISPGYYYRDERVRVALLNPALPLAATHLPQPAAPRMSHPKVKPIGRPLRIGGQPQGSPRGIPHPKRYTYNTPTEAQQTCMFKYVLDIGGRSCGTNGVPWTPSKPLIGVRAPSGSKAPLHALPSSREPYVPAIHAHRSRQALRQGDGAQPTS